MYVAMGLRFAHGRQSTLLARLHDETMTRCLLRAVVQTLPVHLWRDMFFNIDELRPESTHAVDWNGSKDS